MTGRGPAGVHTAPMVKVTGDPGASVVDHPRAAAYRQGVHTAHISLMSHTSHMSTTHEEER